MYLYIIKKIYIYIHTGIPISVLTETQTHPCAARWTAHERSSHVRALAKLKRGCQENREWTVLLCALGCRQGSHMEYRCRCGGRMSPALDTRTRF